MLCFVMIYHIPFLLLCTLKPITLVVVEWPKSLFHLCDFHFNMLITNHFIFIFCGFYFDACISCLVFTSTFAFLCFCFLFFSLSIFFTIVYININSFFFYTFFLLFQYLCVDIISCIHHSFLWFFFLVLVTFLHYYHVATFFKVNYIILNAYRLMTPLFLFYFLF